MGRFANTFAGQLAKWHIIADLEADQLIAKAYGASAVADWIQRSALANISVAICLARVVEPAAKRGQLLPITEACRAWRNLNEPRWGAALTCVMRAAEREKRITGLHTLVIRLVALQSTGSASAPYDPWSAATIFGTLASLEEAALRNEVSSLPRDLHPTEIADLGTVVLVPQMLEQVALNAELFKGQRIRDLPELVRCAPDLATRYREDPHYLLAKSQRELMVPHLLAAFLTSALVQQGWSVRYTVERGVLLGNSKREISPETFVRELSAGEMSKDGFLAILAEP